MLTLPKLLVLVLVILAVWYGYKWMDRVNRLRARDDTRDKGRVPGSSRRPVSAEDMTKCPACGVYVPAVGADPCGRPNCPYRP